MNKTDLQWDLGAFKNVALNINQMQVSFIINVDVFTITKENVYINFSNPSKCPP